MKYHLLYTILLFVLGINVVKAQAPTLIYSQSFSASGAGASGVPTININIPAGNNRMLVMQLLVERNHSPARSNWVFATDGATLDTWVKPTVGGVQTQEIYGLIYRETGTNIVYTTYEAVAYLGDRSGLPTGNVTISFPNINNPERASDEMIVNVAVFDNVKEVFPNTPSAVISNSRTSFTGTTIFSGTGTTGVSGAHVTPPVGRDISHVTYLASAGISQQSALTFDGNWTSPSTMSAVVNNTSGPYYADKNSEPDGISARMAYRNYPNTSTALSFTLTRGSSSEIHWAVGNIIALMPLASPSVSGTVYRDNNGSATIDGGGTGGGVWNTANSLYVNAIGDNGNVVATAAVNTSGVFTFPSGGNLVEGDVIRFQLSRNQGIVGQPAPVKELPSGWATVGESIASGTNDGTADGEFTLTIAAANSPNNTTNRFAVTTSVDVQVNKSGPLNVLPNGTVTYKIFVTNNGPGLASNVVVTDPAVSNFTATGISCVAGDGEAGSANCPASVTIVGLQGAGLTIPSLPSGSAVVFTVTGTAAATGTITNTANATATYDTNPSNNSSTVITEIRNDASCSQSTYTLNLAQTVANNTVALNGGILNLYYTRTAGVAIPGVAEPLIVPVAYSDLNNYTNTNHQWHTLSNTAGFGVELGMATYNNNTTSQTADAGSIYNGLPTTNIEASPIPNYPAGNQLIVDGTLTEALRLGTIAQLGTFTLNFGNVTLPAGVRIASKSLILQGRGSANASTQGTHIVAGYYAKPIIQNLVETSGSTSTTIDTEMEFGQTYTWKYTAFQTTGSPRQHNRRGVIFKSGSITLINDCCSAGTVAPAINPAANYSADNSSYHIPCGSTTANLNGLTASNKPTTATLTWHTATPATDANKITNVTSLVGTVKYYAAFYDSANGCYSPTKELTVFAPICATDDDYSATPIIAGVGGTLPSVFSNDTYNGTIISTMPAGSVGFEYSVWTPSNGTINPATGVLTVPATTPPGTYTYSYQINDADPDATSNSNFSIASVTFKVVSCTNLPATGTPDSYTQTGVSSLVGFANGWPKNVPNGFIAIESKNKGFVITRVSSSAAISNPVEGMLIYDLAANCVKLYYDLSWKCIAKNCN